MPEHYEEPVTLAQRIIVRGVLRLIGEFAPAEHIEADKIKRDQFKESRLSELTSELPVIWFVYERERGPKETISVLEKQTLPSLGRAEPLHQRLKASITSQSNKM